MAGRGEATSGAPPITLRLRPRYASPVFRPPSHRRTVGAGSQFRRRTRGRWAGSTLGASSVAVGKSAAVGVAVAGVATVAVGVAVAVGTAVSIGVALGVTKAVSR